MNEPAESLVLQQFNSLGRSYEVFDIIEEQRTNDEPLDELKTDGHRPAKLML